MIVRDGAGDVTIQAITCEPCSVICLQITVIRRDALDQSPLRDII